MNGTVTTLRRRASTPARELEPVAEDKVLELPTSREHFRQRLRAVADTIREILRSEAPETTHTLQCSETEVVITYRVGGVTQLRNYTCELAADVATKALNARCEATAHRGEGVFTVKTSWQRIEKANEKELLKAYALTFIWRTGASLLVIGLVVGVAKVAWAILA